MAKIYFTNYGLELARAKIFNSLASKNQLNIFDVLELSSGDYLPKTKMEDGKHIVYGGGGLTNATHNEFNVKERTLGIGRVGARCGCCFIIEPQSWVTDNALFISKLKYDYDYSFLMHYLSHLDLNKFANQSAQPVISQRGIAKCTIPNVEIREQEKIAFILDAIENGNEFDDIYNLSSVLKVEKKLSFLQEELTLQQTHLQFLRQAILQEAVQGKLSEPGFVGLKDSKMKGGQKILSSSNLKNHSSDNEDTATLLQRIKAEKQKLIAAGKLKKEKELPPVTEEEIPFELPKGWVWCRLGEFALSSEAGKSHLCAEREVEGSEWGIIKMSAISTGVFLETKNKFYKSEIDSDFDNQIRENDLLFARASGSRELTGISCLVKSITRNLLLNDKTIRFRFSSYLSVDFINFWNNTSYGRNYYEMIMGSKTTTMNNITRAQFNNLLIPLPPLSEQHRIVAKVQQLMQMVNQLEQQVQQSQEQSQQLLQAVLKEAFSNKEIKHAENVMLAMAADE